MGIYKVNPDGKAPTGLTAGDYVVTQGGTYYIYGVNDDGTYQSVQSDATQTTNNYQNDYSLYTGYEPQQQSLLQQQLNYPDFSYEDAPTYNNRYDDIIQEKLSAINNQQPFNQE